MRLLFSCLALSLLVSVCSAEDIVDLKKPAREPDIVTGAVIRLIDGAIDLWPPPINHFIENDKGTFNFRINTRYLDRTARRTIVGRVQTQIYREEGGYGSGRWTLVWSSTREMGNWRRNPRLRDAEEGPFDSGVLTQREPVVRYRIDMKASTHGKKQRNKRLSAITSVVRLPSKGPEEVAMTLLLSNEALLVYNCFKEIFYQLRRRHIDRRLVRLYLAKLHYTMNRIDRLSIALPGDKPLRNRLAWGLSVGHQATGSVGIPRMLRKDVVLPYYCILDKLSVESLRSLRDDIEHEKALAACERAIAALERYGYDEVYSAENIRHELYAVERELTIDKESYSNSLERAQVIFNEETGYKAWAPGHQEPEQKYLDKTFARVERFFNVPRHAAGVQVAAMRSLRGLLGL